MRPVLVHAGRARDDVLVHQRGPELGRGNGTEGCLHRGHVYLLLRAVIPCRPRVPEERGAASRPGHWLVLGRRLAELPARAIGFVQEANPRTPHAQAPEVIAGAPVGLRRGKANGSVALAYWKRNPRRRP